MRVAGTEHKNWSIEMNLSHKIKDCIRWFVPYGIIAHRRTKLQATLDEQNFQFFRTIKNYFLSLSTNDPELLEIINYFKTFNKFPYWYPYIFTRKYHTLDIDVFSDKGVKTGYVIHKNKRLYFPEKWDNESICAYYNMMRMEQDKDSPHCYEADNFIPQENDVIVDIGAAEGIWALDYAEKAGKIYLFECDREWIKALKKTFEPWKEKVVIVRKYVSNIDDEKNVTLDNYFKMEERDGINFIKADIEGMEIKLLEGSKAILANNKNLKLLICSYHSKNDAVEITNILKKNDFITENSKGYMIPYFDKSLEEPYIRRGIIRGRKIII